MAVKSKLYSMTPKEIVAELINISSGGGEKIRCHRAQKPLPEKSAFRGNERRNHTEEHSHDGTDRLW